MSQALPYAETKFDIVSLERNHQQRITQNSDIGYVFDIDLKITDKVKKSIFDISILSRE